LRGSLVFLFERKLFKLVRYLITIGEYLMIKTYSAEEIIKDQTHSITDKVWASLNDVKGIVNDEDQAGLKWYERNQARAAIRDYNFLASASLVIFWGIMLGIIQV